MVINKCTLFTNTLARMCGNWEHTICAPRCAFVRFIIFSGIVNVAVVDVDSSAELVWHFRCLGAQNEIAALWFRCRKLRMSRRNGRINQTKQQDHKHRRAHIVFESKAINLPLVQCVCAVCVLYTCMALSLDLLNNSLHFRTVKCDKYTKIEYAYDKSKIQKDVAFVLVQ